jgi:hypothetical protein
MLSRLAITVAAASLFAPAPALTSHTLAAETGVTTGGATRARSDAWTCHVDPANQFYPSMIIAMATAKADDTTEELSELPMIEQIKIDIKTIEQTLGDPEGWLYVMVKSPKADTPIKVTIECPDVMEASTFRGVLKEEGATYGVAPKIRWKYKELARVRQPLPVNVVFKVKLGDAETEEDVRVCTLHTINDCPYLHLSPPDEKGEMTAHNISFLFAAYVNEGPSLGRPDPEAGDRFAHRRELHRLPGRLGRRRAQAGLRRVERAPAARHHVLGHLSCLHPRGARAQPARPLPG